MSPTDMRPRDYRHTPKGLMPFIQRSPRRHGRPIRGFVAFIGGHPWALAPDAGRVKSNRELVVLQMLYRGRAASGRRIWRVSRRDFRTALPGTSGAEFLPFLNSPRRSRAVTVRKTHTRDCCRSVGRCARKLSMGPVVPHLTAGPHDISRDLQRISSAQAIQRGNMGRSLAKYPAIRSAAERR